MKKSILAAGLIASLFGTPASAAIAYTGLNILERHLQTTSGLSLVGSSFSFALNTQSPADFTSAVVSRPDNSSLDLNYNPFLVADGSYRAASASQSYSDTNAMNAANPFGVYTFTATNAATGASQSSSLTYDSNHWPSVAPMLTDASFASLNGFNSSNPFTFHFNDFTGDGFNPFPNGGLNPATGLFIATAAGVPVYNSGQLAPSTTSFTLPGGVLQPGTEYSVALSFNNVRHAPLGSPEGYFLAFTELTFAAFTTAEGPSPPVTLTNIEGGTPENPLPLPVVGHIGQLTGSIGDAGSTDYFQYFWPGGLFEAHASLTGADPKSSFQFQLYDSQSVLLQDIHLDASNGFAWAMSQTLPKGLFTIGLLANEFIDPQFTITFLTPVQGVGVVPEPSTWGMLILGFAGVGSALRFRRRRSLSVLS